MEESKELKSDEIPFNVKAGKTIKKIVFHDKLNVIFVGTDDREIFVIDPTLGNVIYHTSFRKDDPTTEERDQTVEGPESDWDFALGPEKIIVVNKDKVGIRSEYKGIVLLDTVLQTPLQNPSDIVQIELNATEAESLCHSLAAVDVSNEAEAVEVEKQLKAVINKESDGGSFVASVKKEKWSTVKLDLPHSVLKSTFQSMVTELWKKNAYIPQLSIASSILERLNMLLPPGKVDSDLPLDKNQMFSESARLGTFANWPHTDYKWALPEKMAQAGFYHNPSTNGEDRALCFTCNVCLVSWEPTDEPWSEHERHSPFCPFVRGEHTHNVPLYLSYATAPAFTIKKSHKIGAPLLGKSSFSNAAIVAYTSGLVVVWDIAKQAKEAVEFEVTYKDVESLEPVSAANFSYSDIEMKPKEAWVMDVSDPSKSIIPPEPKPVTATEYGINLCSVAVIGIPFAIRDAKKPCSPSVVVGCTLKKSSGSDEHRSPLIMVYGLSLNTVTAEESKDISASDMFKTVGSTGTKQETEVDEDDLFVSYMSESDILSDSVSIFSDMNMSDSSGTFLPMTVSHNSVNGVPVKKKATQQSLPPKKASSGLEGGLGKNKSSHNPFLHPGPNVLTAQKLNFPSNLQHCSVVREILPSLDGSQLIVVIDCGVSKDPNSKKNSNNKAATAVEGEEVLQQVSSVYGAVLIYNVKHHQLANAVLLEKQPVVLRKIEEVDDLIISLCLIPPDVEDTSIACVLKRGDVAILSLNELTVVHRISRPSPDAMITSVSYCASLERLCCGTDTGIIELFSMNGQSESEMETNDDRSMLLSNLGLSENMTKNLPSSSGSTGLPSLESKLLVNRALNFNTMKQLLQLTTFENLKPCFTANVPSCWVKIIQAQKERKHPQHLQHHESEVSTTTLSWRLQRNKNSKKEHLFELSLPKSTLVGHLDLRFILQMGCVSLPTIEVTLYKAAKLKQRGDTDVDKKIDFGTQLKLKTPSNEFLKSINAEVVCGPLDLGSHVDLSAQGGNIVMTSPSLMLKKGRNFYLHIKAKSTGRSGERDGGSSSSGSKSGSKSSKSKLLDSSSKSKSSSIGGMSGTTAASAFAKMKGFPHEGTTFYGVNVVNNPFLAHHPLHKAIMDGSASLPDVMDKKKDYGGCDWLHEVSITVRQSKASPLPFEDQERKGMLTSTSFINKLLNIAVFEAEENSYAAQNMALDLLVWIAAVNLCGPQVGSGNYQLDFIQTVETKLRALILHGILFADRSTSHKSAKLLVLCIDSVENYHTKEDREPFLASLLDSLLSLLPYTITCVSAGSLQWFFLLLNRVRTENLSLSSEALLQLLKNVSEELHTRTDPMHALLRTRFGLYGTPFEPELFEVELPPVTKSYSHPLTYAGMCGGDNPNASAGSGTFHLWGLKDVDFRDLLVGNPLSMRWGKVGLLSPKQQIQGLLEVEPLHFTCHAASDGTRIEKIDLGINSNSFSAAVPFPSQQPWEPLTNTNMPTGEGSKKSEPDKVEQIMMLQKALKMDATDAYYDVLSDFQLMGNKVEYASYPTEAGSITHQFQQLPGDSWKNVGVLTMVMQNPGVGVPGITSGGGGTITTTTVPGTSKVIYGPFVQPSSHSHFSSSGHSVPIFSTSSIPRMSMYQNQNKPLSAGILNKAIQFAAPPILASSAAALPLPMISTSISGAIQPPAATVTSLSSSQSAVPQSPLIIGASSASASAGTGSSSGASAGNNSDESNKTDDSGLRLLSPWQQMMYVPPQQALVIDRMHSGARRFVVLDFGAPVLLTDMVIPSCNDLVSLSIDIWLHREETDGQRLIVASDIGMRSLVICDLQPPPVCRYLKITTIGRYGMGTTKCRIPVGMFYGHTVVLPTDLGRTLNNLPTDVTVLSPTNIQAHLSVLTNLVEDISCRYQMCCAKLKRLLEPLHKPEISALDHISYYLPKGKERNKLGLNSRADAGILSAYQECITLQQQLNVAKNVVKRLQKSLSPYPLVNSNGSTSPLNLLGEICTDKVHLISEFLIESLLGISFIASNNTISQSPPYSLYTNMDLPMCEALFRNVCVLENGQCQLSTCTLMLRVCGFQPWWGKFLATTLKSLFSSSNNSVFPQDRVFILMVYLGQKALLSGQNSSVLESAMELLAELLIPIRDQAGFLRSKIDMTLLGWVVMFLCLCLDGVNCTLASSGGNSDGNYGSSAGPSATNPNGGNNSSHTSSGGSSSKKHKDRDCGTKDTSCLSSRWDFIQGESALYRRINSPSKSSSSSTSSTIGGYKRRIQKKIMATKQKLEELDNVAAGLGYTNPSALHQVGGLGTQLSALGNKIEAIKQKQASIGKSIKLQSSKHFKDLLQIRRTEMLYRRGYLGAGSKDGKDSCSPTSDSDINLNLNPSLCLSVAKGLGLLLLRMDSTCHSDVYLIVCKALARIATACRPVIPLGAIFSQEQIIGLIMTAVGSDYVRQRNWSSSWISHAIMCLLQDVLEGEKFFPRMDSPQQGSFEEEGQGQRLSQSPYDKVSAMIIDDSGQLLGMREEDGSPGGNKDLDDMTMIIDDVDAAVLPPLEPSISLDSGESDNDDVLSEFSFQSSESRRGSNTTGKKSHVRKLTPCVTSISTALDARLESGVESTTELRLRMMAVVESEVLTQSLKAPIEIPAEVVKSIAAAASSGSNFNHSNYKAPMLGDTAPVAGAVNSCHLLASCFQRIFEMMSSENCSVSIEKVLQLWISINLEIPGSGLEDAQTVKPAVPLSRESITALMMAFSKNTGIGVQEWGLAFQCLTLVANQKNLRATDDLGDWLYILKDKNFPELILRFISGSGMNLQKTHVVSAGPTVCQQFYNFLTRLRELSHDTPWTSCLKEILLRVLCVFLSGPFLNTDFPLDAFNKFLDRVCCPDLSYENPSTVINIVEKFAQALHLFVFFPTKLTIRSTTDLKTVTSSVPNPSTATEGKFGKSQNFEQVMFRLVSFIASCVTLSYKTSLSGDDDVSRFLREIPLTSKFKELDDILMEPLSKFKNGETPRTIADVVLKMEKTMMRILSVLANPNGINVLVSGDLLSAFNIMDTSTPTTVVDSVIHLFSKLSSSASQPSSTIQPIFRFLSKSPYDDFYCPLIVSETFVLMVLKVISKDEHLKEFNDLKCVQSICDKLISSTRKFFSSCPTFVSILTQYIGRTDNNAIFGQKKFGNEQFELPEGLINVAPLGSISSSNYSAHPSEVLLQATPPHRRARTPVWSYHFLPEENFLELVVVLPCAILLKEVQIVPHMTSSVSTACPSAVMVEVSRDRNNYTLPMGPPVQCGGLSTINIQLTQPEVAQTVLLRLFKPKDSSNLGLSQIRLLGCTTFSEAALEGLSTVENTRSLEASAHWMYIMDRAMSVSLENEPLHRHIVETAVGIPDMLESCYSMLMAPVASVKAQEVYLPHVSSVLFQFGSLHKDVSEQLMMALLGPVQRGFSHGMVANANPQSIGVLSQLHTVVELVFKLCCNIPQWSYDNLVSLMKWLDTAADEATQTHDGNVRGGGVVPEYVQAVAATLWSITGAGKTDLTHITTPQLLKKLLVWSNLLDSKSELKACLDHVICSVCYSKPWLFPYLMYHMGIVHVMGWVETKEPIEDLLAMWHEEGCLWDRIEARNLNEINNQLTAGHLMTLGRAAQSPSSAQLLEASQFLVHLNSAIMDFWTHYTNKWLSNTTAGVDLQGQSSGGTFIISTQSLIGILKFYSELCRVNNFKNWFGTHGSVFWLPILNLLSTLPGSLKSSFFGAQACKLESSVINFLAKCCWSHPENQNAIAACLCEIVVKQKVTPHKAVFLHSMSSFCRRLLIQLLLENERVIVHVKSGSKYPLKNPGGTLPLRKRHPSMGVHGGDRIFYISTYAYIYELMKSIEPFGVTMEKIAANSGDPNRFLSMLKKEQGLIEAGLEMIDQMQLSMSGNAAKDKRSQLEGKRPFKTATKKLKPESGGGTSMTSDGKSSGNGSSPKDEIDKSKGPALILESEEFLDIKVPPNIPVATLMAAVRHQRPDLFLDSLVFTVRTEMPQMIRSPSQSPPQISPSPSTTNFPPGNPQNQDIILTSTGTIITNSNTSEQFADISSLRDSSRRKDSIPEVFNILPLPSTIEIFSRTGGLGLLAKHLPVVYPETLRQIAVGSKFTNSVGLVTHVDKDSPMGGPGPSGGGGGTGATTMADADWVKIESSDDFYDEMMDSMVAATTPIQKRSVAMRQLSGTPGIPPHSMAAFGLFLGLPRFSEVLLGERIGAQCMLRLVMGVTDDAEGNDIFGSAVAKTLPTLPFQVLRCLLDVLPVSSDEGKSLRQAMTDIKAIHFILACLAVFTHQNCDASLIPGLQHELVIAATKAQGGYHDNKSSVGKSDDKSHVYWAKGTGFGTGSTAQSWDIELALQKKKQEEENVTCLLHVLSSFIHPRVSRHQQQFQQSRRESQETSSNMTSMTVDDASESINVNTLPKEIMELLKSSCLFPAIAGYLRNDSVLDMARHVPLYKSVLQFLRSLVSSQELVPLLSPWERKSMDSNADEQPISCLLSKMKDVVDNYSKRLTTNSKGKGQKSKSLSKTLEDLEDEGLAMLIPDIQNTAVLVQKAVTDLINKLGPNDIDMEEVDPASLIPVYRSLEDRYQDEMKKLQFAFYDMITEDEDTGGIRFTVSHHYEGNVRNNWSRSTPARLKRLAQESVTLSTSLPIAYGSTIFVRCDTDRLDIMKVLITGPAATPYANGCFEFDVFFPNDYPNSPMMINLETTGRQRIRFNPNLYTDGKVCLSILNTWHGRPEEKWNPQTSSLLPVLVAIQSLILNAEPYYNEPGYEKSRGTDAGERNSREYNAGIEIATVEWAMLDQIRHPSPCFKEVIHRHFWIKRSEVLAQCEKWLENLIVTCRNDKRAGKHVTGSSDPVTVFKNNLALLKKEFANMKPPEGLEDLSSDFPTSSPGSNSNSTSVICKEEDSTLVSSPTSSVPGALQTQTETSGTGKEGALNLTATTTTTFSDIASKCIIKTSEDVPSLLANVLGQGIGIGQQQGQAQVVNKMGIIPGPGVGGSSGIIVEKITDLSNVENLKKLLGLGVNEMTDTEIDENTMDGDMVDVHGHSHGHGTAVLVDTGEVIILEQDVDDPNDTEDDDTMLMDM